MNRVFIHNEKKISLINLLFIMLIPFILYGFYKNGILEYNINNNIFTLLKPFIMFIFCVLISYVFCMKKKENILDFRLISNIIIYSCTMINVNIIVYILLLILLNILFSLKKINIIPIYMIIIILINIVFFKYSFLNSSESLVKHSYSILSFLLGKGVGGISNTFLLGSIISFIILCTNIEYKKQIPIIGFITYYSLITSLSFITATYSNDLFINNNIIFAFIFICPLSLFSPYSKGADYIYGVLLGLLTFAFSFIDSLSSVYLSILFLSFLSKYIDNFIVNKSNKKH